MKRTVFGVVILLLTTPQLAFAALGYINEPDFIGVYGDTVAFTAEAYLPGTPTDDHNINTIFDAFGESYFRVGSSAVTGDSFLVDPVLDPVEYQLFFPTPGDYVVEFVEIITGNDLQTNDPVETHMVWDSRNVSLSTVPEPSSLALAGIAGLVGIAVAIRMRRCSAQSTT